MKRILICDHPPRRRDAEGFAFLRGLINAALISGVLWALIIFPIYVWGAYERGNAALHDIRDRFYAAIGGNVK